MSLIILLPGIVFFFYILVRKPEIIAVLLFTFIMAKINFDVKALPLNTKALITMALFGRIMADKETRLQFSEFLGVPYVKLLIVFLVYVIFISLWQDVFKVDFLKESIGDVMTTFCIYHFYFKLHAAKQLKAALIISGIICFSDLVYTYVVFGSFPMHRIYYQISGLADSLAEEDLDEMANWNYFGQMCGMGFVYILCDYVKNKSANKYTLWLLPVMLGGVMMSTSRSAILALLIISILIILNSINYQEQKKKLAKVGTFSIGVAVVSILLFASVGKYVNLNSKIVDEITSRLTQEPVAIIQKAMGQSYNVNNLGSMDWREESAENAYIAYMNMDLNEQLFGIGSGGFEKRNLGHGFNAHNATLLLLIENGIVGFCIYFLLVGGAIVQSILWKNFSPSLAVICFILIYGLGQNREWTSLITYLFVINLATEVQYLRVEKRNRLNDVPPAGPTIKIENSP
ncbi:MAG: O-antigen ligase family protein [Bacteroidota bacterium]|nr:O-antigen ligase family protein [Bacteroidota bacterium]